MTVKREDLWNQQFSGHAFPYVDTTPDDFKPEDVSAAISKQCRYGGACRLFYSVAQHSVLCMLVSVHEACRLDCWENAAPERATPIRKCTLLHDVHEGPLPDLINPVKWYLRYCAQIRRNEQRAHIRQLGSAAVLLNRLVEAAGPTSRIVHTALADVQATIRRMEAQSFASDFDVLEQQVERCAHERYGITEAMETWGRLVAIVDRRMLWTEQKWLHRPPPKPWVGEQLPPYTFDELNAQASTFSSDAWRRLFVQPWSHRTARRMFERSCGWLGLPTGLYGEPDADDTQSTLLWDLSEPLRSM